MYGKLFSSMYDGTLCGQWEALVTFQQMIVLCDADGIVDMTAQALAARTSIPLKIIEKGIAILEGPDPYSRTPDQEGRRIERIDAHRPWGWHLVNHEKYKTLQDSDTVREQTRDRVKRHREKRKQDQGNAVGVTGVTLGNGQKPNTDTNTETDKKEQKDIVELKLDAHSQGKNGRDQIRTRELRIKAIEILAFLNAKATRNYKLLPANVDPIVALLRDGATEEDCRAVIAKKCREWLGDEKMNLYLRPKTLFNRTNFANYQGELAPAGNA